MGGVSIFHWSKSAHNISAGIGDIGVGLHALASSVSDCHMEELADIIRKLAVELGVSPMVFWAESLLHILIRGPDIVNDFAGALTSYGQHNFAGFGFYLIKLIE